MPPRTSLATLLALAVCVSAQAGDAPSPTPVADALRTEAGKLRDEHPDRWAACDRAVKDVFDRHAAVVAEWKRQSLPPPPDVAALDLPACWLAQRAEPYGKKVFDGEPQSLARALAHSKDPRGLDLVLEWHDARPVRPDRDLLARLAAEGVPAARAAEILTKQLEKTPRVAFDESELPLLVLERHADLLPAEVRRAARDWLATYAHGPSNGAGERVWPLRLRLGGAADRDAFIPHVLRIDAGLLSCLLTIVAAPMTHARLADALRRRRDRMTDHERSFLVPAMRKALLVTDPEHEAASYLARIDELLPRLDPSKMPTDDSREFDDLAGLVITFDEPRLRAAARRLVKDPRPDWIARCNWLELIVRRKDAEADDLVTWWKENAPEPYRSYLGERLRDVR